MRPSRRLGSPLLAEGDLLRVAPWPPATWPEAPSVCIPAAPLSSEVRASRRHQHRKDLDTLRAQTPPDCRTQSGPRAVPPGDCRDGPQRALPRASRDPLSLDAGKAALVGSVPRPGFQDAVGQRLGSLPGVGPDLTRVPSLPQLSLWGCPPVSPPNSDFTATVPSFLGPGHLPVGDSQVTFRLHSLQLGSVGVL